MHRLAALFGCSAVLLFSACAATPSRTVPARSAVAVDPARPAPAYGDSCAPVIEHARLVPTEPLLTPPVVRTMIPVFDAPERLQAHTYKVYFDVDSAGTVIDARIDPILDSAFAQRAVRSYRRATFHPAILHGCGVPGRAVVTVEYRASPQ